jgi:Ca2+-binding EF-hand superfamily protein
MNGLAQSTFKMAVATFALAALAACAAGPRNPSTARGAQEHFRQMDKNDDGVLMRDEINPDLTLAIDFTIYDVDGTGAIELDEFYQYIEATSGS